MAIQVPGTELSELQRDDDRFAEMVERELRSVADQATQVIGEVLVAQGRASAASPDDLNGIPESWLRRLSTVLLPWLERYIAGSVASQVAGVNTALGVPVITALDEQLVTRILLGGAQNRLVGVGDELWQNARDALSQGVADGASIQDIAREVRGAADVTAPRATTVARTEVVGANNKSSIEVMRATGLVAFKRWVATFDGRVRLSHIDAHGQTVALDETFFLDGGDLDHPGDFFGPPEEVINCRCTMGYVVDEDAEESESVLASAAAAKRIVIPLGGTLSTRASAAPAAAEVTVDWFIEKNHEECTEERPWAVVKEADGSVEGCHETREDAVAQLRALLQSEAEEREDEDVERAIEEARTRGTVTADVGSQVFQDECPPGMHPENGRCVWNADLAFFEGVAVVEGEWTGDGRQFAEGSLTWEDLDEVPATLQWQKETSHGGINDVTVSVGRLTNLERSGSEIRVMGYIDANSEDGAEVVRRLRAGTLGGVSIVADDPEQADVEFVFPEGCPDLDSLTPEEIDEMPIEEINRCLMPSGIIFHSGRVRALTLVDTPAFVEATIHLVETESTEDTGEDEPVVISEEFGAVKTDDMKQLYRQLSPVDINDPQSVAQLIDELEPLLAASHAIHIPDLPPAEWFNEPKELPPFGALTVTDEGRVYGLLAPRDVAHRSYQNKRVTVPTGNVDYTRWMNRETIVDGGQRVMTGPITMDCGHASTDPRSTAQASMEHYDNSCSLVATVRIGESQHGVWVAGALLPGVTPVQVTRMLACQLSGDWRQHREQPGMRELVAALLVPVPGFATASRASVRMDQGQLVASAVPVTWKLAGDVPSDEDTDESIVAAVIGSTDLPIADRDRAWDGSGARGRVFDTCTDGDAVDTDCVGRAFLWRDPDQDAENRGAYSLGFADMIDGRLQIVPRGVAATAGGRGVGAADIPEADKDRIRTRICTLYDRIRDQFEDWPPCPFEGDSVASLEANDAYAAGEIDFEEWRSRLSTVASEDESVTVDVDVAVDEPNGAGKFDADLPSWDDVVKKRELRAQTAEIAEKLQQELGIEIGV